LITEIKFWLLVTGAVQDIWIVNQEKEITGVVLEKDVTQKTQ